MAAAASTSSAPPVMERPNEDVGNVLQQQVPMQMRQYNDDHIVRLRQLERQIRIIQRAGPGPVQMHHDQPMPVLHIHLDGRQEPIIGGAQAQEEPKAQEENVKEVEEEEEDEDMELLKKMEVPRMMHSPILLDKFHHILKVGFFVASLEVLTDRDRSDVKERQKFALEKAEELIKNSSEVPFPEEEGRPLCGSVRMVRDIQRMARQIPYYQELLDKFVEEFDGSSSRLHKLRQATGFMKGLLVFHNNEVYNNLTVSPPGNHDVDMDIFKVNSKLFLEWLVKFRPTD
ncbi:unnamed protein product [Caenorhabditis brenneri]